MQTLRIEIPKGFVIDSIDKESGVIKLTEQPKNITERIKTVDDVLAWHNLDKASWARSCADLTDDEKAYRLLKLLAKALNQGWTPDWNNHNEYKYFPWFEMGGSSGFRFFGSVNWVSSSFVGSRLCYKTRELSDYAGKQFIDLYKQFMTI
jgi:hypothetical protein